MNSHQSAARRSMAVAKCVLKWGTSLSIVGYLLAGTDFRQLASGLESYRFDSFRFTLGFLFCGFSVYLTLVRWRTLLETFGVPVPASTVLRVGLLGYALNLLALGSIGGDLGRAVLMSKQHPDRSHRVVLSVAADRIIGLYAMFVLAFVLAWSENLFASDDPSLQFVAWITAGGTLLMPVGAVLAGRVMTKFQRYLRSASRARRLIELLSACRGPRRPAAIRRAFLISLLLRTTTAVGIFLFGSSLIAEPPGVRTHLLAASVGLLTGCLPLPFNGLGALEGVLEFLFQTVPGSPCPPGYGIAVALLYRLFLLVAGVLGVVVFSCRPRTSRVTSVPGTVRFDSTMVL